MKEVIYSHSSQPVHKKTARHSFLFLFGFTQVRFNFIDDVISLYEVG